MGSFWRPLFRHAYFPAPRLEALRLTRLRLPTAGWIVVMDPVTYELVAKKGRAAVQVHKSLHKTLD